MSYQIAPQDQPHPPPGYPPAPHPPPHYSAAPLLEAYPGSPPPGPLPPQPSFEGYQRYFVQGHPPLPPQPQRQPPSLPHCHHHHRNDQPGCASFLQFCLPALCCCVLMEECCCFMMEECCFFLR